MHAYPRCQLHFTGPSYPSSSQPPPRPNVVAAARGCPFHAPQPPHPEHAGGDVLGADAAGGGLGVGGGGQQLHGDTEMYQESRQPRGTVQGVREAVKPSSWRPGGLLGAWAGRTGRGGTREQCAGDGALVVGAGLVRVGPGPRSRGLCPTPARGVMPLHGWPPYAIAFVLCCWSLAATGAQLIASRKAVCAAAAAP